MSDVAAVVFQMGLVGSLVILVVLVLRLFLSRAPKVFSYALWLVVLFRLLCPVALESEFSLLGPGQWAAEHFMEQEEVQRNAAVRENTPSVNAAGEGGQDWKEKEGGEAFTETASGAKSEEKEPSKHTAENVVQTVLIFVWLAGIAAILGCSLVSELRLRHYLKGAEHERDNIYIREGIDTPFVMGCFLPKIYLPKGLKGRELEYILLHEQIHIKRRDPLFRRLAFAALALHWMNPFVWIAFFLSGRDMEMSCDEAVVRRFGEGIKREYSSSLLAMSVGKETGMLPLAFGERDTRKRIGNILQYKRAKAGAAAGGLCVLMAALIVLATNPKEQEEQMGGEETEAQMGGEETEAQMGGEETEAQPDLENSLYAAYASDEKGFEADITVKSVSRSGRLIDRYDNLWLSDSGLAEAGGDIDLAGELAELGKQILGDSPVFAGDCEFFINYNSEKLEPQSVDFDTFADCFSGEGRSMPCRIAYRDGQIHSILLLDYYYRSGLSHAESGGDYNSYEEYTEFLGSGFLEEYYTRINTLSADIADLPGEEIIEVYTTDNGEIGGGGIVVFKSAKGDVINAEVAALPNAGNQNIYVGKIDGGGEGFIMTLSMDDRWDYGFYAYNVYRFDGTGGRKLLAGSYFEWGGGMTNGADALEIWSHYLGHYLKDSVLLFGTAEGNVRTGMESDSGRYTYEEVLPEKLSGNEAE
ncbi:MAG: M56 family metallopeptidase [Muribaculaceae bacterium]|nr:M56 family metallopeptidase [Roseburia sp.]MCM1430543.1 M56 family metallopeptidase [Muribaculaceae bacterium]MCM1492650.1 M56 family metallopeptidase [Muribaculaceae bacterium]